MSRPKLSAGYSSRVKRLITILAAPGDLIYFGENDVERLPIGANGRVLTIDTSLPGKLKWAVSSGGGGGGSGPGLIGSGPPSGTDADDAASGTTWLDDDTDIIYAKKLNGNWTSGTNI
jgi:hypothetical protein